jgi:hypothetical protein
MPVANPIVRRELLELLRTRRAVAAQVGLAVAVAALIVARWPSAGVGDLSGAAALQVLRVFGYGLLAGLLLILPAFPATAIVREKVRGTLALLLNSPMSVVGIYLGKLGGVLGFTGLLLAATLPAAAACYALGGSTGRGGIVQLYAVLAMAAVQIATLGLFVSSRAQGTDGALRATYALVLALCVLPLAAHWMIPRDDEVTTVAAEWLGSLSPIPAVMESVGQGSAGLPGTDFVHSVATGRGPARPGPAAGGDDSGSLDRCPRGPPAVLRRRPAPPGRQHQPVGQSGHGEGVPHPPVRPVELDVAPARVGGRPLA